MTATELLEKQKASETLLTDILTEFAGYRHNGKSGWNDSDDLNSAFREELSDLLLKDFSIKDLELIRFLLNEEILYARHESMMHDTFRQLAFMLYCVGSPEDTALLIEARLDSSFDASLSLEAEFVLGRDKEATKAYFEQNPHEDYDIPAIIREYEEYQLRSPELFMQHMREYFGLV